MAKKKIHKVVIKGEEYFIWADTKQGAVRDVIAHIKSEVSCEVASGQDLFYLGACGGKIIGEDGASCDTQDQKPLWPDGSEVDVKTLISDTKEEAS